MLLDLYALQTTHGEGTSTKSACHAANVPYSTAWRVLALLEDAGLVERCTDAQDKRLSLVRLTKQGEKAVRRSIINMTVDLAQS
jgi:DNA-binding MarR family transcriptional regulator